MNIQCLFQPATSWESPLVGSRASWPPKKLTLGTCGSPKIGDMGWLIWKIYTTWCGSRILFFCRDPGATAQVWATTSPAFIPLWSIFLTQTCQVQLPKMAASTCFVPNCSANSKGLAVGNSVYFLPNRALTLSPFCSLSRAWNEWETMTNDLATPIH